MFLTLPDHTADKHLFLGTGAKPRTIHSKPNERRPSTTMDEFSSAKQTEFPMSLVNFFFHSTRTFFGSRLKFQNFDSDFEISNRVCSRDSCLVFFRSWTYILQISTHVFYCVRCILQVSTKAKLKKKRDVSRPRPLHFLAPPLFFIFMSNVS